MLENPAAVSDLLELEPCRLGAARGGFHTRVLKGSGLKRYEWFLHKGQVRLRARCEQTESVTGLRKSLLNLWVVYSEGPLDRV